MICFDSKRLTHSFTAVQLSSVPCIELPTYANVHGRYKRTQPSQLEHYSTVQQPSRRGAQTVAWSTVSSRDTCYVCRRRGNPWEMMCSLQQSLSSICQRPMSDCDSGSSDRQSGSKIERPMGNPKFVEHLVVASVAEFIEGEIIEDLVKGFSTVMAVPGVLATNVGRCEPMLGEHTFMIHIRAVDTESCDAAYRAAEKVYGNHLSLHNINRAEDLNDIIIVDFNSEVIGAHDAKWPATRIAIFQYKKDIPEEKKKDLIKVLDLLPTLFPSVKQVSWGHNIAKERTYRNDYGYADVDHELGVILGFSCCQDMYDLGDDPKYWELLNFHGISLLEKYQVLTICEPTPTP